MGLNLGEELQQRFSDYVIDHEHDPKEENIEDLLEDAVESIAENSENIKNMHNFDVYASVLRHAVDVPPTLITKLLDSLQSGFQAEVESAITHIADDEQHGGTAHKEALEMYAFLFYWFVDAVQAVKADETTPATPVKPRRGRGGKASKAAPRNASKKESDKWTWAEHIPQSLTLICRIMRALRMDRVWTVSSEREAFMTCITNPVYDIANEETHMKLADIKTNVLKVICLAVKHQGHGVMAQTKIFSNLQFKEHLADPMADCLSILVKEYDHPQIADAIFLDLSNHSFSEKETKGPRIFSRFLVRFSEQSPAHTLKQISVIMHQLDSEAYPLRIAVVEIFHNLVVHLDTLRQSGDIERTAASNQINKYFKSLVERALDVSTYVRTKVLGVLSRLCHIFEAGNGEMRLPIALVGVASLEDKAAGVRKNAITLIISLLKSNPYTDVNGTLNEDEWTEYLDDKKVKLQQMGFNQNRAPEPEKGATKDGEDEEDDAMDVDDATDVDEEQDEETQTPIDDDDADMDVDEDALKPRKKKTKRRPKPRRTQSFGAAEFDRLAALDNLAREEVVQLRNRKHYAENVLTFIQIIDGSSETMVKLLASVNKTEVLEVIEFYFVASTLKLNLAEVGIKQMIHLIWQKDNATLTSEDGQEVKGVRSKLLDCYQWLYFEDEVGQASPKAIARNLTGLTYNADLAHLTSLEEMLRIMMAEKKIPHGVIETLWKSYAYKKHPIPKPQRRGSIVILSMLALADHTILHDHVDVLLQVGFGKMGKMDLTLARYTCVALQRLNGSAKKVKGSLEDKTLRFEMDHPVFIALRKFILLRCRSKEWFGVAEQIINTVYALGTHPDVFCQDIIKELTRTAFTPRVHVGPAADSQEKEDEDEDAEMSDRDVTSAKGTGKTKQEEDSDAAMDEDHPGNSTKVSQGDSQAGDKDVGDAFALSQLLFVVGHVAIKQIVFIELAEREMKRQRDLEAAGHGGQASKEVEELDQVVGNAEDEVGDQMAHIRETSLLFGDRSLLKVYGKMMVKIVTLPSKYKNETLRAAATLSLSKFLCVSSSFCGEYSHVLFWLLSTSKSPSIRSNIAIALGDVAVSFSTIIDENSHELYRGLSDPDLVVKKNTLMVLTHLILNGMIKVKGQLGEMAKCLVDENERIKGLGELFFKELSTKDNAIYNNLPDVISHLSAGDHSVDEDHFHNIMTHIFKYVEKDKQTESIVDKLCQRFRLTQDARQWRDIAFCLSLLPYKSERSVKKLIEGLPHYRDKLHEPDVYDKFNQILVKARQNKGAGKPDTELNEFAAILEQNREQGEQDNALEQRVQGKKAAAKKRASKRNASNTAAPVPTRASGRNRRRQEEKMEDEDEDDGLS